MSNGYLAIILHAHLPYVRHPEHPDFLEEDWLYEALSETYLPLLGVFEKLAEDSIPFQVAMTLTPPLCEMLVDELLMERYQRRLDSLIELSSKEVVRMHGAGWGEPFESTARMYLRHFSQARALLVDRHKGRILSAFRALQDAGHLDILCCTATHGLLPLIAREEARRAQIEVGCANYEKHFGRRPAGIWLPECGFSPGDDRILAECGLTHFCIDSHGIVYGSPPPRYGIFAPVRTEHGLAAFPRDVESSRQVWSATEGYPGDPEYREFYRDLGYDAEEDYIRPYLHPDGIRRNIGLKYYRVTGKVDLDKKEPYHPDRAAARADIHAGNFMFNRELHADYLVELLGRKPLIVSAFDAELFGHWWFEGPLFLERLFRRIHGDQKRIELTRPSVYLEQNPELQRVTPSLSTWGAGGYNRVWLNGSNDWMYRHLCVAEERMVELANSFPAASGVLERALDQAARELLLAQSSDWPFIMTTGTTIPYAQRRFREHVQRFTRIYEGIHRKDLDLDWLTDVESKDNIFPEIDYEAFGTR